MKKEPTEAELVLELEAIVDVQQRIDRVAEDLASGVQRYASIDSWTLGDLLGLHLEDAADGSWYQTQYVWRQRPEDNGDVTPLAANVELLHKRVPTNRYKDLARLAASILESESQEDLPLTNVEEQILRDEYHRQHAGYEGITISRNCVRSSKGQELWFEVTVNCGDAEEASSPYDLENGNGFDDERFVPAE